MSKNRKKLLLPLILSTCFEVFYIVMMIAFWGKIYRPIGAIIFGVILTFFFVLSLVYFISPDKFFSDDKTDKRRKVRATLFNTNVELYDDGASEEYINACIKFFNAIPKETIVNKAHEHFEQIRSISEGPGIDEVADYGDGDNILIYIKLKAMHLSTEKGGDPEHVWFIMEGDTPWSDGFEFVVADNKLVKVGEYTGDFEEE